jgi:hypothetical protein
VSLWFLKIIIQVEGQKLLANIVRNNTGVKVDFKRNLYTLYVAEVSNKLSSFNFLNVEKYKFNS